MNPASTPAPLRLASFRSRLALLRFALGVALIPLSVHAQTTTWNNTAGVTTTNFNTASNWSSGLPGSSTRGVFSGASAVTPSVTANISVSGLTFDSTATGYSITGSGNLTLLSTGTGTSSALLFQQTTASSVAQINAPLILGGAAGSTQTFTGTSNVGTLLVNSNISSTNSVNLSINTAFGSGVVLMGSASTYSGNTSVTGNLRAGTFANSGIASSLGTGSLISLGSASGIGTLIYQGSTAASSDRTIDLPGTTSGGVLDSSGTGALTWKGNVTASGAGNKIFTLQGTNSGGNLFYGQISDNSATNKTTLRKQGTGQWVMMADSSYTGGTLIQGGTMFVFKIANGGVASPLGASSNAASNLTLSGNSILRYAGPTASTDRLFTLSGSATIDSSGTGALNFTNTGSLSITGNFVRTLTLTGTYTGAANTLAAAITEPSASFPTSVTKASTGTWVLSGTSTYTGATTVSKGNLTLLGSLGNTPIFVASGATFAGTGTAMGSLSIASGGTIAPGDGGIGTLTVGSFTWTGGGNLDFDLGTGGSSDRLAITGALGKSGSGFDFDFLSGGTAGNTYTLLTFGSNAGAFSVSDFTYSNLASGLTGTFAVNATSLTFSVGTSAIPEPSTYAAIFGGLALTGALWHRRRKQAAVAGEK